MNSDFLLLEDNRRRDVIRTIVRDLITVFKTEVDGEFYLPMYINDDKEYYNFPDFGNMIVEFEVTTNEDIDTFLIDANYYRNENIIQISVEYNPEKKTVILYDLVGELNEIVAHEIRHIDQKTKGTFNLDIPDEKDPYKYYTQPHEIDAQVFGFKRLSKLSKTPFDAVVKRWFKTHKEIHQLSDQEANDVISKILNYN